jgi:hypothetical protein
LRAINGWQWTGGGTSIRLARLLLEELGIEEQKRRVFISHKREDGWLAAEQLHDRLAKHAFDPFIDRFDIRVGADVQATIADALESHAFLLLLETPLSHTSDWVYDEVDYALAHQMGLHIITWPDTMREVPGSNGLRRQLLADTDLTSSNGYDVLTEDALERAVAEIEAAHALGLVRRRRTLLGSVEVAAQDKGMACTPLLGWRMLVTRADDRQVVAVTARLPEVVDLMRLDDARMAYSQDPPKAALVHSARTLRVDRRDLLAWAAADRPLTLVPENAIGGYW